MPRLLKAMPIIVPRIVPTIDGTVVCLQRLAPTLANTAGDSRAGSSDWGKFGLAVVTGTT